MSPEEEETLDVEGAIECLNKALAPPVPLGARLHARRGRHVRVRVSGLLVRARRLRPLRDRRHAGASIEKITTFEGEPTTEVAPLEWSDQPEKVVEWLIEAEEETIEALQAAIEPTGREGVSEALEHLLEHLILRKQNQVDFLIRARRRP